MQYNSKLEMVSKVVSSLKDRKKTKNEIKRFFVVIFMFVSSTVERQCNNQYKEKMTTIKILNLDCKIVVKLILQD